MMDSATRSAGGRARPFLLWLLVVALALGGLALFQRTALDSELQRQSATLHRLASQQADQHDAHMTALSAIAVAGEGQRFDLFLEVAATIMRFYQRIDAIQLVPLAQNREIIGTEPLDPQLAQEIRAAARSSDGHIALLPDPALADHYRMVKRSPNTDAALYALTLRVNAEKLLSDAGPYWSRPGVAMRLSLPDGEILSGPRTLPVSARYSKALGSASQPLLLETGMRMGLSDLFPPARALATLTAVSLLFIAGLAILRQRARTRDALQQVRLSAMEARLTHASRINALGEMASGMAHELTQPLTAILAQAQAGRRLLEQKDEAAVASVLDDTVKQARRASDILERFRNWSRPQRAPVAGFDLRNAIANVRALLAQASAAEGIEMDIRLPADPVRVAADPVEMEQVVFNLMRNALEALEGMKAPRHIVVELKRGGDAVTLDISDNGPGLSPTVRGRLFTPFTTTRPEGTGLGLALSQRLVERAHGEIFLKDGESSGTTFRIVLPPAVEKSGEKE